MNLNERLQDLIDHEVTITMTFTDDAKKVPPGVIEEVGDDYLILKTEEEKDGKVNCTSAEWIISLITLNQVIHHGDCRKCALDVATNKLGEIFGDPI